jgi:hypothetical protein
MLATIHHRIQVFDTNHLCEWGRFFGRYGGLWTAHAVCVRESVCESGRSRVGWKHLLPPNVVREATGLELTVGVVVSSGASAAFESGTDIPGTVMSAQPVIGEQP